MKVLTVVGARPQFIKASPVSGALREAGHREFLVHTGQHYDRDMSKVFFEELGIPEPDINLQVGSGSHGWQVGKMLIQLEEVIKAQLPDCVLVYGDTNSTLAGALAAVKLRVPLAHVEAGLRSYNREMPEEHNRVLTDHCSDVLLCPTHTAVSNLAREGITKGVYQVGDTMYDAVLRFAQVAQSRSGILEKLKLEPKGYLLATIHRPQNTDDPEKMRGILETFRQIEERIVFPVHPRTRKKLLEMDVSLGPMPSNVEFVEPLGYFDMLVLEGNARAVVTDSGGMQKEAYFLGTPCVTLRYETEWVETVNAGWNQLVGVDPKAILEALKKPEPPKEHSPLFGDGQAASKIVHVLQMSSLSRPAVAAGSA